MKKIQLIGMAGLSLVLSACATSTHKASDDIEQERAIARWHQCLDRNYKSFDTGSNSPYGIIEDSLVVCQGHKRDVLATFPEKFEGNLGKRMETNAYETGFESISEARGVADSITTSFNRMVASQKER